MGDLGVLILSRRKQRGLSRRQVARAAGISEEYLRRIETMGKVPNDEVVIRLAEVLEIDMQQAVLMAHRDRAPEAAKAFFPVFRKPLSRAKELVSVPVVAYVDALEPFRIDLNKPAIDEIPLSAVTLPEKVAPSHLYAVRVKGNSMLPLFRDGDDLVAKPASIGTIREADVVIFQDVEGNSWVKLVEFQGDEVIFRSLSPLRRPIRRRIDEAVKLDKVTLVLRK